MAEISRGVWGPWKEVRCVLRQPGSQAERQGCGWRQSTGLLGSSLGFSASSFPTCRTLASPRFCLENLGPRVISLSRDPSHSLSHTGRSQPRVFQTASPLPARPPPRAEPPPRPRAPGPVQPLFWLRPPPPAKSTRRVRLCLPLSSLAWLPHGRPDWTQARTHRLGTECSRALWKACHAPSSLPAGGWGWGRGVGRASGRPLLTAYVSPLPEPIDHDQHHSHWEDRQHPNEHSGIRILVPEERRRWDRAGRR